MRQYAQLQLRLRLVVERLRQTHCAIGVDAHVRRIVRHRIGYARIDTAVGIVSGHLQKGEIRSV